MNISTQFFSFPLCSIKVDFEEVDGFFIYLNKGVKYHLFYRFKENIYFTPSFNNDPFVFIIEPGTDVEDIVFQFRDKLNEDLMVYFSSNPFPEPDDLCYHIDLCFVSFKSVVDCYKEN
jgi:hypothetical protein